VSATPTILICAGLDPSGGAGLLADARIVAEAGGRAAGIVTALTVQNTTGVAGWTAVDPEIIAQQLAFLLADVELGAIKLGMVGSIAIAQALGEALSATAAPLVWDPVMMPSRGAVGLEAAGDGPPGGPGSGGGSMVDVIVALRPHLAVVTPNAHELHLLTGRPTSTLDESIAAARWLEGQLDAAVIVKGGHLGDAEAIDVVVTRSGEHALRGPRLPGGADVHGTGCALASAIATRLARGDDLVEAVRAAKALVAARIAAPARPGRGAAAIA
jgi:hydroxymethylpyrimidine/phosphomethylpyrimidine kinase